MIHTKIQGDHTRPVSEGALCLTCRSSMLVKGPRLNDGGILCRQGIGLVTFHVSECSAYDDARKTAVWELERAAWIRMEDRKGRVRFISPIERAKQKLDDD